MSEASDRTTSGGIGFFGLLAVLFIGLKLTGFIDWSWWWVLAPLWGPLVFIAIVFVVMLLVVSFQVYHCTTIEYAKQKKERRKNDVSPV